MRLACAHSRRRCRNPWQLPPKIRAEAAQQEARGHAMLGVNLGLVERKLDNARAVEIYQECLFRRHVLHRDYGYFVADGSGPCFGR